MTALKRHAITFLLGLSVPVALALYCGGEAVTQIGLRQVALEQGIALALRHHSWAASADAEPAPVVTRRPETARKVAKR